MIQLSLDQTLQLALQHHRANRLAEAETLYQQVLAQQPNQPDATYLLGVLLGQLGRYESAIPLIDKVITLHPANPELHTNRGEFFRRWGKLPEAIASFQQVIKLKPQSAEAYDALATALLDSGQLDAAANALRTALQLQPHFAQAHYNLGNVLFRQNRPADAILEFQTALRLNPQYAQAHNNLGFVLMETGRTQEALACFHQALQIDPRYAEAYNNLGTALVHAMLLDEAVTAYEQAIKFDPHYAPAYNNLGNALKKQGRLDDAINAYQRALTLRPNHPRTLSNLATTLKDLGQIPQALASFQSALDLQPHDAVYHSNILLTLHYPPGQDPAYLFRRAIEWNTRHAEPLRPSIQPHPNIPDPARPLRLGYVSPDFRGHAIAFFLLSLLQSHDKNRFHITCYDNGQFADEFTTRFQNLADAWRTITGLSDDQAARQIREDRIDILIDLAGHTAYNRLTLFARKPAPLQITWLGYPDTTGLSAIDFRLSDPLADPPQLTDPFSTEKILRLPDSAWCFTPLSGSPPISPPPAVALGAITFGTFNSFSKINEPLLDCWRRMLESVPRSRLLLKNAAMGSPAATQHLRNFFAAAGIAPDRLLLLPFTPTPLDHLQAYAQVDIALDTFPYNGTTTTCEALWMGVPVITLAGTTHHSRVGASLLTNAGLPECIAATPEDYIQRAVNLARDLPRLERLRSTLRPQMQASPLMNAPRFAQNVERAFRQIWQQWCAAHPSSPKTPPA